MVTRSFSDRNRHTRTRRMSILCAKFIGSSLPWGTLLIAIGSALLRGYERLGADGTVLAAIQIETYSFIFAAIAAW